MHILLINTTDKMISAFSWMLIDSLWQGLLLAIVTCVALVLAKRSSAVYRYNLALGLFVVFISVCVLTFVWEWNSAASQTILPSIGGNVSALIFSNAHDVKQLVKTFTGYFSANAPLIVLIWFILFLFKSVKMIGGLVYNQRIRTRQVYEPGAFWSERVTKFSEKLQVKRTVRLFQSGYIKMPVVVGHLKPVILIPIGLLAGLPAEQVEAILLHELAHIRRNDYFVNFLQNIAETIFFFNPGLLWISSLLREERENCCDDLAVAQTNNKRGFVEALISFKERELHSSDYAIAFPGKRNYLLRRVSRIMNNKNQTFGFGEKIFLMMSVLIFSAIVTTATVVQISDHTTTDCQPSESVVKQIAPQKVSAINKTGAKKSKSVISSRPAHVKQKMQDGIVVIRGRKGPVTTISKPVAAILTIASPVLSITPTNGEKTLADKKQAGDDRLFPRKAQDQAEMDQVKAKQDMEQAMKNQAQAKLDQEQAIKDQARAVNDQAQAKLDQAQAIKDQIKAKLNQKQAMKEKADADAARRKLN